ncbi:hypothetical protein SAMN05421797_106138 [Maribacter ulvicola]|uniref:Uncharacterized protein n=1 Tax=Maribacter ulvicola TaxID=228959 RepID=A0A1N6Y901_9FLAO|nr:hypothetical protein SAMN05421797_106138 [Maribacter ulvicola]
MEQLKAEETPNTPFLVLKKNIKASDFQFIIKLKISYVCRRHNFIM